MNIFSFIFQEVLYRPLLNLLVFFYQLPYVDFGMAILFITILIRLLVWPLNSKMIRDQRESQSKSQEIREKLKEIQEKYKGDTARQNEEVVKLWKEMKFNPLAGFAPMIIQIVVLIALYQVLRTVMQPTGLSLLYSFVPNPGEINPTFLKFLDLSKTSPILAILTGVVQYFYSKMTLVLQPKISNKKKNRPPSGQEKQIQNFQKLMQGQMMYLLPAMTVFVVWSLPAALSFYWFFSTLIGILQQKIVFKSIRR